MWINRLGWLILKHNDLIVDGSFFLVMVHPTLIEQCLQWTVNWQSRFLCSVLLGTCTSYCFTHWFIQLKSLLLVVSIWFVGSLLILTIPILKWVDNQVAIRKLPQLKKWRSASHLCHKKMNGCSHCVAYCGKRCNVINNEMEF